MLEQFGLATILILGLGSFFLAALLGAVLTRPGAPLEALVVNHFRVTVLVLFIANLGFRNFGDRLPGHGQSIGVISTTLMFAMLFVPMLRRLQGKTENRGV